jgi:glyoxylase-like metal-dependent hydrolase (beta-lactamase superfamily II)
MRKIITVDCDYLYPHYAAAFLIVDHGRAAFIENNTSRAVPKLLEALETAGISPENVEYLIITHAHLDHAGGTSALLRHCPNAKVLAHPKAARTIINPERLVASARQVYGDQKFESLYGDVLPVDASRVVAVADGQKIKFGTAEFEFIFTLGHATHHICVIDAATKSIFTGDSFGVRYPDIESETLFLFPTTSPIDFDPVEAKLAYQKIVDSGAEHAYLTHFGQMTHLAAAQKELLVHLEAHISILAAAQSSDLSGKLLADFCEVKLQAYFEGCLKEKGIASTKLTWDLLKLDIELNAAGIAYRARI